ncbi:hypothetical protein [Gloeobacter violaceus]|uniref:Gll2537 protein n=1 Tax=Gloeobacter violaceus (strain ATCC 29082 / PCC 7421) TaxID=251221 RepID=Q7NHJ8_GLOVI|nr:hypothetical protein [Gloeobacter violaceus]BAC90478.1 gll2537 [Gloeobacter violaceus PCC 7421]
MKKCKELVWDKHLSARRFRLLALLVACGALFAPGVQAADEVITERVRAIAAQMDASASQENLDSLFANYATSFKSSDGLGYETTRQAVSALWEKLAKPTYQTNVTAVVPEKNRYRVNATTRLQADYKTELGEPARLESTVETVSRYEDQKTGLKLVSQEIAAERTTLSIGGKPPQVSLNLPSTVRVGKNFKVEAVLATPLQEAPALGGIRLTPITTKTATALEAPALEPLRTGGLFKTGQAPSRPEDQAVTLAFVREGGLVLVNQRLKVTETEPPKPEIQPPAPAPKLSPKTE